MIEYLDLVSQYFGDDALMRPIRLNDLSDVYQKLCREGEIQLLPSRDFPLGRRILVCMGSYVMTRTASGTNRVKVGLNQTCK